MRPLSCVARVGAARPALVALVAALGLLLPAIASAAPPRVEISAPLLQFSRPGAWVPVHVDITTTEAVQATVVADFDGTDGIRGGKRTISVPKNSSRRVVLPVPVPDWGSYLDVSIRDGRGKPFAAKRLELRGGMNAATLNVAVVGEEPLGWPLLKEVTGRPVPGHPDVADDGYRSVAVQNLLAVDLPDHWFGYSTVDILVWRRPDPTDLSPEQQEALRAWVASGGTLLLALGDNHAEWAASPLAVLVPADVGSLERSPTALAAVWSLAGSGQPPGVEGKSPDAEGDAEPPGLPVVELSARPGAAVSWTTADERPLVLTSWPGTGKVVMLAFDPAAGELRGGFDRALLWREIFGLWAPPSREELADFYGDLTAVEGPWRPGLVGPPTAIPAGTCAVHPSLASTLGSWSSAEADAQQELAVLVGAPNGRQGWWSGLVSAIGSFSAAAPLSLGFIVLFGLGYLFVIGPLDYFVLRRLGRPMLTWATFPVLAIGFSVAAGLVVQQSKAGDSERKCLSVVDVYDGADVMRGESWCAIWASRRTDIEVRPARGKGWVAPSSYSDFEENAESWYGYEPAITGEELRQVLEPGQARLAFEAAQWSSSNVRSTWFESTDASAEWYRGPDGAPAVRSALDVDLLDVWVVDGASWYRVGDLPAGASRQMDLRSSGPTPSSLQHDAHQAMWGWAFDPVESTGHLHLGNADRPVLVGFAATELGHPVFEGLGGVDSSTTLVRVPLTRPTQEVE